MAVFRAERRVQQEPEAVSRDGTVVSLNKWRFQRAEANNLVDRSTARLDVVNTGPVVGASRDKAPSDLSTQNHHDRKIDAFAHGRNCSSYLWATTAIFRNTCLIAAGTMIGELISTQYCGSLLDWIFNHR